MAGGAEHTDGLSFDEDPDPIAVLDLLGRVRPEVLDAMLMAPPASTWSRAHHVGEGQWPLRSRAQSLGMLQTGQTRL